MSAIWVILTDANIGIWMLIEPMLLDESYNKIVFGYEKLYVKFTTPALVVV